MAFCCLVGINRLVEISLYNETKVQSDTVCDTVLRLDQRVIEPKPGDRTLLDLDPMRTSYVSVPGQCSHVGGMQRKGGEEEIAHRGWCCEDGREVGNGCVYAQQPGACEKE